MSPVPPCDGLVFCEIDSGDCVICEAWTPWTADVAHLHVCSAPCLSDARELIEASIARERSEWS